MFAKHKDDEQLGLSSEDSQFLEIIGKGIHLNSIGNIEMPLPLRPNFKLPDNRHAVFNRTATTLKKMKSDNLEACLKQMQKCLDNDQVEQVPTEELEKKHGVFYLPVFCVAEKRKKPRLVFDSSATYSGVSLNSILYKGPDLNNSLRDVLLRFRERPVAIISDIEAMFHCFYVNKEHRDYLRFFWFRNNDPKQPLVVFRAKVHIFGNKPSPPIATIGLRNTLTRSEASAQVQLFVRRNFYVDDALKSAETVEEAIDIIKGAQSLLSRFNIRLHKIASSHQEVLQAFPEGDLAKGPIERSFEEGEIQRALGVAWEASSDNFKLVVQLEDRPFTRRGILSVINSIFDPLGFVSPVALAGRIFQRKVIPRKDKMTPDLENLGWDDPIPEKFLAEWKMWQHTLKNLAKVTIPRSYVPLGFHPTRQELHIFVDASQDAIGHCMYMRSINEKGEITVRFVCGSSKVSPHSATSIPRLELCAALDGVLAAKTVSDALERIPSAIYFHTDSMVVLGYISNEERRFSNYVTRRIQVIKSNSEKVQWAYVPTDQNPADLASRPTEPKSLISSCWFTGPHWLSNLDYKFKSYVSKENIPEDLPEEILEKQVLLTSSGRDREVFTSLFSNLSSWKRIRQAAVKVLEFCHTWLQKCQSRKHQGLKMLTESKLTKLQLAQTLLIKEAQESSFPDLKTQLQEGKGPINHPLMDLSPRLISGIIRVGGRLSNAKQVPFDCRHPILVPKDHPLSRVLLHHYHEEVKHQGRVLTHAAIRAAGYHLVSGRSLIRSLLQSCVQCRKLRARPETQMMADLPGDRVAETTPFSNCGMDVFGPFYVSSGKVTRSNSGKRKMWVLLLTCLASRAVHVELLEGMDTSSFKMAISRFFSIRGKSSLFRSDQGTNFIGAHNQAESNLDLEDLRKDLQAQEVQWEFNPPHASHFGGAWERKIKSIRDVMSGTLLQVGPKLLSREELETYLKEACAIVNNTPLWDNEFNPDEPCPITPAMLLTLKDSPNPPGPDDFSESDLHSYGKRRWRRAQYLSEVFWDRWRSSYIQELQKRKKWKTARENVSPNDIVLIKDQNLARNCWPIGKVVSVKTSADGLVRSATVFLPKTNKTYQRPVVSLVVLVND